MLSPIVLFVYNRPWHTQKTIEALLKNEMIEDSILYIFADGPKDDADKTSLQKIADVRSIIHKIKGPKQIIITERDTNMGLDTSIINGVSKVMAEHHKCIVLEDDIVTQPLFLRFMNDCLNKYQNNRKVWMIGGYNIRIKFPWWFHSDVYFVHRCNSWGWGMWEDRWEEIDWSVSDYHQFLNDEKQKKIFCRCGEDMLPMLIDQMTHAVPAWDIRFDYTLMKNNGLVLRPTKTLVINYGLDGSGIHCGIEDNIAAASEINNSRNYTIQLPSNAYCYSIIEKSFRRYFSPKEKHRITKNIKRRLKRNKHVRKIIDWIRAGHTS